MKNCKYNSISEDQYSSVRKSSPPTFCLSKIKPKNCQTTRRSIDGFSYKFIKPTIDIILSAVGLFFLSPLFILISLMIKINYPGKIFYRQKRCKENGSSFWIYKFRTMPENSENCSGPMWPSEDNSQCTRIGQLLRTSHLDELPQLINILKRDMSLVGPRPERPYFVNKFKKSIAEYEFRHRIKPGLTGWAQINGYRGSNMAIKKRVLCDIFYIKRWSLWFDFKIIIRTILPKIFFSPAATVETFPKMVSAS